MIEPGYILIFLGIGIMLLSFLINIGGERFNLGLLFIFMGAAVSFTGAALLPNYSLDFCESNNGIYDRGNGLELCSISNLKGDYEAYKILKVGDKFKLVSFADEPYRRILKPIRQLDLSLWIMDEDSIQVEIEKPKLRKSLLRRNKDDCTYDGCNYNCCDGRICTMTLLECRTEWSNFTWEGRDSDEVRK